eukprot:COSAG02_NODE_6333_length_3644_cov_2.512553_2_plen_434_part_00
MSVMGSAVGKKRKKKSKKLHFDSEFVKQVVPHAREGSAKLRACFKCKLVKTEEQWEDYGCLNCNWDSSDFMEETTQDFGGMIAMCKPEDSWVAKWQGLTKLSIGVYAKSISSRTRQRAATGSFESSDEDLSFSDEQRAKNFSRKQPRDARKSRLLDTADPMNSDQEDSDLDHGYRPLGLKLFAKRSKRYLHTGLEAAQLRLALGSLLHPRLALDATIKPELALDDVLFSIGIQPQLQFRCVSLNVLRFRSGSKKIPANLEERLLPAQMPVAELLDELHSRIRGSSIKAHYGPIQFTPPKLDDLDQDRIVSLDKSTALPTIEQFVVVEEGCLVVFYPRARRDAMIDIGHFASHRDCPGREYLRADGAKKCTASRLKALLAMVPNANYGATFRSITGPVLAPSACATLVQYLDRLKCDNDPAHPPRPTGPFSFDV